jgi:hypothetical protein
VKAHPVIPTASEVAELRHQVAAANKVVGAIRARTISPFSEGGGYWSSTAFNAAIDELLTAIPVQPAGAAP